MDVEAILDKVGIEYVESGSNRLMVRCPFHDDNNPSCGVWADSGWFKCFGCGKDGSLADLIAEHEGIEWHEAKRIIGGEERISSIQQKLVENLSKPKDTFKYYKVSSFHKTYPKLEEGSPGWEYMVGRNILPEMIRLYDIRQGTGKYANRVVLPIYTVEGKLVSYVGRSYRKGALPKTKKSRSPHRTLFGLKELVTEGRATEYLVVVEGEIDAIYLQQYGVSAVANMGTMAMGAEKISLLRRYSRRVVLSYDGDEAGRRAMYGDGKTPGQVKTLSRHVPTVSVHLPEGVDPNDLSKEQVEETYGRYRV